MATNYETDVLPREDAGQTNDVEIAAILTAMTAKPIPIAELENYLTFQGLSWRNEVTGNWEGPLIAYMQGYTVPALSAGLEELFRHINKQRSTTVDTTALPWSLDAYQLVGGLLQVGQITLQQWTDFYLLGGGRPHGDLVDADIAALRQAYLDDQAAIAAEQAAAITRAALRSKLTEHYNANIAPVMDNPASVKADFIAGLRAAADAWEAEV